jgi:hypothetical protein
MLLRPAPEQGTLLLKETAADAASRLAHGGASCYIMIEEELTSLVEAHYADENASLLLLSHVGKMLSDAGLQPEPNDRRSLRQIVENIADLSVVRDPEAAAFIAVVRKGDEKRAEDAIVERHQRHFLRGLPRALLLAFTLELAQGQTISLQLTPKIAYQAGPTVGEGWIEVDSDLRLSGVDATDIDALDAATARDFEARIRAWCDRHQVDPASLVRLRRRHGKPAEASSPEATGAAGPSSALERLYEAQEPHIAKRLTVPIDIALVLSRIP